MFSHCVFTVCSFGFIIGFFPVRYVSYYTIVAYAICVMIGVGRVALVGGGFAAI